jgi:hypothetical protein
MANSNGNGSVRQWATIVLSIAIAVAGAVWRIEARVGDEAEIRRDADIRIESKIERQQERIEDKLDRIIERQIDGD